MKINIDFFNYIISQLNNNNIAVVEDNKSWSYSDFATYSLRVYEYLKSNKINRIMICLPQSFYAYAIIWGAYCAKVTFCPVATSTPLERIKYYSSQFMPDIIVSDCYGAFDNRCISSCDLFTKPFIKRVPPLISQTDDRLLAYVIFTSGSTGLPKGVMIERRSLENFLGWSTSEYDIKPGDKWGQYSNLGFDLSICDIFTAILKGATLIPISGKAEKLLPAKVIKNKKITFWHSVPSVIDLINKAKHLNLYFLGSLKTMVFCGEKLFPSQIEMLFNINPSLVIYNTYGPTETTIICSFVKLTVENYKQFCHNTVSIGQALPGFELSLSDDKENANEIIIISDYIASGYLNCGDKLKMPFEKIIKNGIQTSKYKTGDFGEIIEDNLYFIARRDSQIKIMGYRIDLNEIDYRLREYGCKTSITTYYNSKIISFVIHEKYDSDKIIKYLSEYLPVYYLPHIIINKQEFPYNVNGKIDINKLLKDVNL